MEETNTGSIFLDGVLELGYCKLDLELDFVVERMNGVLWLRGGQEFANDLASSFVVSIKALHVDRAIFHGFAVNVKGHF